MSDMKCPVCNKTLHCGATLKSDEYLVDLYQCANPECESTEFLVGCKEFWDILGQHIRTRKALDVAVGQLKRTHDYIEDFRYQETNYFLVDSKDVSIILDETNEALEQITALEQKDK